MQTIKLQAEAADIFQRLDSAGLTQRALAERLGIEENKVSKVRKGERQFKAAEVLSALEWLQQATQAKSDNLPVRSIDAGETVQILRLDLSLPMGPGATVDDYVEEEPVEFDMGYLRAFTRTPAHRLRLARGVGDSMMPTLLPNDEVLIDTTQNQLLHADRIYACTISGGAAIKRLRPVDGGQRILVISDNRTLDPYPVDAREVRIWGRIIRFARDL